MPSLPARGGGDEWTTALEQALDKECGRSGNAVPVGVPIYSISLPEIISAVRSTALAPAAVVMPERRTDANYPTQLWREAAGWNAALDEVARLNRRAIPAGELERIAVKIDDLETASGFACGIGDELRALLGKEEGAQ